MPEQKSPETFRGIVKWFDEAKGYGFISRNGLKDLFVHFSGIKGYSSQTKKSLIEGQEVEFEVNEGRKGPEAQKVSVVT